MWELEQASIGQELVRAETRSPQRSAKKGTVTVTVPFSAELGALLGFGAFLLVGIGTEAVAVYGVGRKKGTVTVTVPFCTEFLNASDVSRQIAPSVEHTARAKHHSWKPGRSQIGNYALRDILKPIELWWEVLTRSRPGSESRSPSYGKRNFPGRRRNRLTVRKDMGMLKIAVAKLRLGACWGFQNATCLFAQNLDIVTPL